MVYNIYIWFIIYLSSFSIHKMSQGRKFRLKIKAHINSKSNDQLFMNLLISPTCTFTLFLFVADSNAIALKLQILGLL